jgi:hypothetical protein
MAGTNKDILVHFQHLIPVFTKYSFSHGSFKFEIWCSKLWVFFNWTYGKLDFQKNMNIIMLLLQFKMNVCVLKIDNRLSNFCIWVSMGCWMLLQFGAWSSVVYRRLGYRKSVVPETRTVYHRHVVHWNRIECGIFRIWMYHVSHHKEQKGRRRLQELLTLPEHLSSPPDFSVVRITRSLVCVCFVDRCFSFCTFSFGHCAVDIRILITPLVSTNVAVESTRSNIVRGGYEITDLCRSFVLS